MEFINFLGAYYFMGLLITGIILSICRAILTGSNWRAYPCVILGALFWFTGIVPLSNLIHFHDIRLLAEKKRQEKEEAKQKTSDK